MNVLEYSTVMSLDKPSDNCTLLFSGLHFASNSGCSEFKSLGGDWPINDVLCRLPQFHQVNARIVLQIMPLQEDFQPK